jgi:hypothetical protein
MTSDYALEDLKNSRDQLVENIREYSENRKKEWQKLPYLALKADGGTGWSNQYKTAYLHGFWWLEVYNHNGHKAAKVDLETGKIASPSSKSGPAPVTEFEAVVADYVGENSGGKYSELVSHYQQRSDLSKNRVKDLWSKMVRKGDLKVTSDRKIELPQTSVKTVSDAFVAKLSKDLNMINPHRITRILEEKADEPVGDYYDYDEEELEEKQEIKAKYLGLSRRFSRT